MPMKTSDPIILDSRANVRDLKAWLKDQHPARADFLDAYVREVERLCQEPGTPDFAEVVVQSIHETSENGTRVRICCCCRGITSCFRSLRPDAG